MAYKSPQAFFNRWNGNSVDVDGAYGAQCWDAFAKFCIDSGVTCSTYCRLTGYAGDLYKLRYEYGYDEFFEFFYPKHAQRGDWIFWDRHVAMVWDVYSNGTVLCFGQNQGGIKKFTLRTYNLNSALGCMRWKGWITMDGWIKSNGKWYFFINGEKVTGWKKLTWSQGEDLFYFDANGVMATGWRSLTYKGKVCRFYFAESGAMAVGLVFCDTNWYYFDKDGVMQTGEIELTLEFDDSGKLIGGR